MTTAHKLTVDQRAEMVRRYIDGEQSPVLAAEYGVNTHTVLYHARKAGKTRPQGGRVKTIQGQILEQVKELRAAGGTQAAIAAELGLSQIAVSRALRAAGLPTQTRVLRSGGRVYAEGYVLIKVDANSPYAEMRNHMGYVPEHRLVMAQLLGRVLTKAETVHHVDGVKDHNTPDNLQLRQGNHGKGIVMKCNSCGSHDVTPVVIGD